MSSLAPLSYWLLLMMGSGLLASCSHERQQLAVERGLEGNWEWTQTTAGQQAILTPANTGHRMTIRFDRRGRASFYQDDMLVSAANFTLRRDRSGLWGPRRYTITYVGYQRRQAYSLSETGLQLQDITNQPATHYFRRTDQPIITSAAAQIIR